MNNKLIYLNEKKEIKEIALNGDFHVLLSADMVEPYFVIAVLYNGESVAFNTENATVTDIEVFASKKDFYVYEFVTKDQFKQAGQTFNFYPTKNVLPPLNLS